MLNNIANIQQVVYAAYPVWLATVLMIAMTSVCWWAFTYSREGYMPQFYGSIRVICASTGSLRWFPSEGIQWGDRESNFRINAVLPTNVRLVGMGLRFRRAGFSADPVAATVPGELYCSNTAEAEHESYSRRASLKQRHSSDSMMSSYTRQPFQRSRSESLTPDYQPYGSPIAPYTALEAPEQSMLSRLRGKR